MKLDFSVLDAPTRKIDAEIAEWCVPARDPARLVAFVSAQP